MTRSNEVGQWCAKCFYEPAGPSGLCHACAPPLPKRCHYCGAANPQAGDVCDAKCAASLAADITSYCTGSISLEARDEADRVEDAMLRAAEHANEVARWKRGTP